MSSSRNCGHSPTRPRTDRAAQQVRERAHDRLARDGHRQPNALEQGHYVVELSVFSENAAPGACAVIFGRQASARSWVTRHHWPTRFSIVARICQKRILSITTHHQTNTRQGRWQP